MRIKRSMNDNVLLEEYYSWLCNLVETNKEDRSYFLLMDALFNKEFKWSVPNDDNRIADALELRERFCEEELDIDYENVIFDKECSMLEILIALSYRCEFIVADMAETIPMIDWFWKLIDNIGIDLFDDEEWSNPNVRIIVDESLNDIIERRYKRDGKGGLFPLKKSKKDQRKLELWYQMSAYLLENYYYED